MRTLISILWISFFPLAAAAQDDDLSYRLKKVIKDKKAEIGIAVILDAQDTVTVNNDDRYPLMSVFKFHQALAVADYLDRNGLTPDTEIFIPEEELVPDTYSPLREEFPEGEISLSVSRLLEYSLQLSDNNACDILFEHTGGPATSGRSDCTISRSQQRSSRCTTIRKRATKTGVRRSKPPPCWNCS